MVTKRLANITLLVVATSICVLACETPVPDSFEGSTDAPPKVGKSNKESNSNSKSNLDTEGDDPAPKPPASTPTTTPAPTTPAPAAEAPVADCKARPSWESCLACCDTTTVYPAFLARLKACNGEATCEKTARDGCFADKACSTADKCLLPNGCWQKETDAEIAEKANPPP